MTQTLRGVGASEARLDGWAAGQYQRFANTAAGVAELLAFCRERRSG